MLKLGERPLLFFSLLRAAFPLPYEFHGAWSHRIPRASMPLQHALSHALCSPSLLTRHAQRQRTIAQPDIAQPSLTAHSSLKSQDISTPRTFVPLSGLSFTLKRLSHPLRHCTCPLTTAECCRLKLPSTIALLQSRFGLSGLESPIRHRPAIIFALQEGRSARHPLFTMTDMLDNRCSIEPIGETLTVTARRRRRSWCARCMSNGSARQCKRESVPCSDAGSRQRSTGERIAVGTEACARGETCWVGRGSGHMGDR